MRKTGLMTQYIRDYDEMDWNDPNKTWQWLVEKGRASYDRARKRGNHMDTLHVLSGSSSVAPVQREMAMPAIEDVRQQGNPNLGKGQSRANGNPSSSNSFVDPGQWSDGEPRPKRADRPSVPDTAEQHKANGPCWFFARGGCIMPNCKKEHRAMTREEVSEIPQVWMTERLSVIALDAQAIVAAKVMAVKMEKVTCPNGEAKTIKVAERAPKVANSFATISRVHSGRNATAFGHTASR
jgi:hypothetical protein